MTPGFRLYCFAQSGNAFKVALMLNLCGAKWEARFVDFFNGETRTPGTGKRSTRWARCRCSSTAAKRLSQSGVILHYLADHFGKFQGEDKLEVLRWMLWDNHKLTSYIATLRSWSLWPRWRDRQVHEFLRGRIKGSLGILDKHLSTQRICRGECADDRRLLHVRLPVLAREFGVLERLPAHRRVAGAHPQTPRLGTSLRADAGPSVEEVAMLQAVELTIRLHPDDDVVIARLEIPTGTLVSKENVRAVVTIPAGHKLAVRDVAQGKPVRRYNQIIGFATRDIKAGRARARAQPGDGRLPARLRFFVPEKGNRFHFARQATFQGIVRADGRVATRNYIGILTSVNCSATVARMVADHFQEST